MHSQGEYTHTHTHTHGLFAVSREGAGLASEVTDLQFVAVCQTADRWGAQRSLPPHCRHCEMHRSFTSGKNAEDRS